ncbi:MAG TPA: type II secretion system protein [Candidatus Omnitrophota bacterium]|nr:type II secretion system protein [Candidatus Omnitrophota bacterium]
MNSGSINMINSRKYKAFTIVELIVVVVVMGAIAGFAIPNYTRSVENAHYQDAVLQLKAIHSAQQIYKARSGQYWPTDGSTHYAYDMNNDLNLNLIEDGITFSCASAAPATGFSCQAERTGSSFTVTIDQAALSSSNPSCTGNCP